MDTTTKREITVPFGKDASVYLIPADGYSCVDIRIPARDQWGKVESRPLVRLPDLGGDANAALDQINTAKALMYRHVEMMTIEHDLLHMWLAKERGHAYSPVLYAAAGGDPISPEDGAWEESDVLGLQYAINTGHWIPEWGTGLIPPNERDDYRSRALDFLVGLSLRMWE